MWINRQGRRLNDPLVLTRPGGFFVGLGCHALNRRHVSVARQDARLVPDIELRVAVQSVDDDAGVHTPRRAPTFIASDSVSNWRSSPRTNLRPFVQ